MFILYFFAHIFFSRCNFEMFHRNSESDKTVHFLGKQKWGLKRNSQLWDTPWIQGDMDVIYEVELLDTMQYKYVSFFFFCEVF